MSPKKSKQIFKRLEALESLFPSQPAALNELLQSVGGSDISRDVFNPTAVKAEAADRALSLVNRLTSELAMLSRPSQLLVEAMLRKLNLSAAPVAVASSLPAQKTEKVQKSSKTFADVVASECEVVSETNNAAVVMVTDPPESMDITPVQTPPAPVAKPKAKQSPAPKPKAPPIEPCFTVDDPGFRSYAYKEELTSDTVDGWSGGSGMPVSDRSLNELVMCHNVLRTHGTKCTICHEFCKRVHPNVQIDKLRSCGSLSKRLVVLHLYHAIKPDLSLDSFEVQLGQEYEIFRKGNPFSKTSALGVLGKIAARCLSR
jgi:hypothetical protein